MICTDSQLTLEGKTTIAVAIERIRAHEPPDGYYLAFSGGKDSTVVYDLTVQAGVKFDAHYSRTGIDPPELVQHIRTYYPTVAQEHSGNLWALIPQKGMPIRTKRWCCEFLKENNGAGRIVITGVRWQESPRRKGRRMFEICIRDGTKRYLNPIIDWKTSEVWAYIRQRKLPYCKLYDEGFTRLGCVLCPMASPDRIRMDSERWPKLAAAWKRAAERYWQRQTPGMQRFPTADDFWAWWLSRAAVKDKAQCVMFE